MKRLVRTTLLASALLSACSSQPTDDPALVSDTSTSSSAPTYGLQAGRAACDAKVDLLVALEDKTQQLVNESVETIDTWIHHAEEGQGICLRAKMFEKATAMRVVEMELRKIRTARLAQLSGPPNLPPLTQEAVLDANTIVQPDGRLAVAGETNLPDNTLIMVSLEHPSAGNLYQSKETVRNGRVRTLLGPESGLPLGKYRLELLMLSPQLQPDYVRSLVGEKGEKLKGKLVKRTSDAYHVVRAKHVHVGRDDASAEDADRERTVKARQEIQDILKELQTLHQQGQAMSALRNIDELDSDNPIRLEKLKTCGQQMRAHQSTARAVRKRAEGLPPLLRGHVSAAAVQLEHCVSCSTSLATSGCKEAAEAIRDAKAEAAKLK